VTAPIDSESTAGPSGQTRSSVASAVVVVGAFLVGAGAVAVSSVLSNSFLRLLIALVLLLGGWWITRPARDEGHPLTLALGSPVLRGVGTSYVVLGAYLGGLGLLTATLADLSGASGGPSLTVVILMVYGTPAIALLAVAFAGMRAWSAGAGAVLTMIAVLLMSNAGATASVISITMLVLGALLTVIVWRAPGRAAWGDLASAAGAMAASFAFGAGTSPFSSLGATQVAGVSEATPAGALSGAALTAVLAGSLLVAAVLLLLAVARRDLAGGVLVGSILAMPPLLLSMSLPVGGIRHATVIAPLVGVPALVALTAMIAIRIPRFRDAMVAALPAPPDSEDNAAADEAARGSEHDADHRSDPFAEDEFDHSADRANADNEATHGADRTYGYDDTAYGAARQDPYCAHADAGDEAARGAARDTAYGADTHAGDEAAHSFARGADRDTGRAAAYGADAHAGDEAARGADREADRDTGRDTAYGADARTSDKAAHSADHEADRETNRQADHVTTDRRPRRLSGALATAACAVIVATAAVVVVLLALPLFGWELGIQGAVALVVLAGVAALGYWLPAGPGAAGAIVALLGLGLARPWARMLITDWARAGVAERAVPVALDLVTVAALAFLLARRHPRPGVFAAAAYALAAASSVFLGALFFDADQFANPTTAGELDAVTVLTLPLVLLGIGAAVALLRGHLATGQAVGAIVVAAAGFVPLKVIVGRFAGGDVAGLQYALNPLTPTDWLQTSLVFREITGPSLLAVLVMVVLALGLATSLAARPSAPLAGAVALLLLAAVQSALLSVLDTSTAADATLFGQVLGGLAAVLAVIAGATAAAAARRV
jgi:hypothetical protein